MNFHSSNVGSLGENLPPSQRASPLQILCGKAGVFELIAAFAGFTRGVHMVSIMRGMIGPFERAPGRAESMEDPDSPDDDI